MRVPGPPQLLARVVLSLALLATTNASGQVRWDVGGQVGAIKRFATGGDPAAPSPDVGPLFELQGHLALVPMVRIGAYLAQDISPASGLGLRTFWAGGLHLKLAPPLLSAPWRTWVFAGFGYAYTAAASYQKTVTTGTQTVNVLFESQTGGMLEVPVGLGLGYRLRGRATPWLLVVELGGRIGAGFFGPMYGRGAGGGGGAGAGAGAGSGASALGPFVGKDSFAMTLCVGLSFDQ